MQSTPTATRLLFVLLLVMFMTGACADSDSDPSDGDTSDGDTSDGDTLDGDVDGDADGDVDGDTETPIQPDDPNTAIYGGFTISVDPDTAELTIESEDGRKLFNSPAALSPEGEDAPPTETFAVRDITMAYQMLYGAFKPTDEAHGPWQAATRFDWQRGDSEATLTLYADDTKLATLTLSAPSDGHLTIATEAASAGKRLSYGFACDADDHFLGFGAQTWDVDHRGQTVPIWVQEQGIGKVENDSYTDPDWMLVGRRHSSHLPVPQYLSRRGYVFVAETWLRSIFALCSEYEDRSRVEIEMPATLHIFDGPTPQDALKRSSAVFGRPRLPPAFAFAPWIDATHGEDEVMEMATALRDEGVPSSVIWTEDWKGANQVDDDYVLTEEWEYDPDLYPNISDMIENLHGMGFKFFAYFNTFIFEHASIFAEVTEAGYTPQHPDGGPYTFAGHKFPHQASVIDFSNPDAKAWVLDKLTTAIDIGVDGWMGDFAEWMPTDALTMEENGLLQHNKHPVQWQQTQREALDAAFEIDGVERLFFGRSGYLGTPELADVIWAADQNTTFAQDDGIKTVLPIGIGLGLCGISTFGHDIAGYQSRFNDPSDRELFFRWTALGAWSPVMRTHHGYQAGLNWEWFKDELTIAHFRRYAKLHIALAPYWRGLAQHANQTGLSIWRGLGVMFPDDATVWPITDQVMVGDKIMIAPIVDRAETAEADVTRNVYLPEGSWYAWNAGDGPTDGGTPISVSAPMGEIPVYAMAGAVVPMYPDGVLTLANPTDDVPGPELVADQRIVRVYLGASGSFSEAEGYTYSLVHETDTFGGDAFAYANGTALAECASNDDWNCVLTGEARILRVRVQATAEVTLNNNLGNLLATLVASEGAETLNIEWRVTH